MGVGGAGARNQQIEQRASLRSVPGLPTLRPGDANEVAECWRVMMQLRHEPATLILSRQALPTLDRTKYASAAGRAKGAYVLADSPPPRLLLLPPAPQVSPAPHSSYNHTT